MTAIGDATEAVSDATTVKDGLALRLTALFSVIKAHLCRRSPWSDCKRLASTSRNLSAAQIVDHFQDSPEQVTRYGDFGHLEDCVSAWVTTLALILTSFSHSVVSDHVCIGSGRARVRRKLAML